MMGTVLHQAGFSTNIEAIRIFRGKFPVRSMDQYINIHTTHDAIISDLLVHDYPVDTNCSGARNVEVIFDVNTL